MTETPPSLSSASRAMRAPSNASDASKSARRADSASASASAARAAASACLFQADSAARAATSTESTSAPSAVRSATGSRVDRPPETVTPRTPLSSPPPSPRTEDGAVVKGSALCTSSPRFMSRSRPASAASAGVRVSCVSSKRTTKPNTPPSTSPSAPRSTSPTSRVGGGSDAIGVLTSRFLRRGVKSSSREFAASSLRTGACAVDSSFDPDLFLFDPSREKCGSLSVSRRTGEGASVTRSHAPGAAAAASRALSATAEKSAATVCPCAPPSVKPRALAIAAATVARLCAKRIAAADDGSRFGTGTETAPV
mmetsp:Transcript_9237/g.38818  ORF Transcript_9237/g.38818 Transcript_9237/m.38818 type:complete len:311 (-) Transcript_9237:205-1137(-)